MCPMPCHNATEIQGVEFYKVYIVAYNIWHTISGYVPMWVYCSKMTEVIHDEKILIHFFYNSLSGVSLS
jgi:hypothetical protein